MRNLATVQLIKNIIPIIDADNIVVANILGWQCIVGKNDFNIGDLCVFFEVDSFLPIDDRYEFLRKSSYRNNELLGEGFRLKTIRLRNTISQGLALSLSLFPEINNPIEGMDVSELLSVKKWEIPEMQTSAGTVIGDMPFSIHITDETRIQTYPELLDELKGKQYYISTKMNGTSCTIYHKDKNVGVCGHYSELKDEPDCSMWNYFRMKEIDKRLKAIGLNIALQGEFCGAGINGNDLGLMCPHVYIFNAFDLDTHRYLNFYDMRNICNRVGLDTVPIEEIGQSFNYSLEEILKKSNGKYECGNFKEGIVVRPIFPIWSNTLRRNLSFKVLNNEFLLKDK